MVSQPQVLQQLYAQALALPLDSTTAEELQGLQQDAVSLCEAHLRLLAGYGLPMELPLCTEEITAENTLDTLLSRIFEAQRQMHRAVMSLRSFAPIAFAPEWGTPQTVLRGLAQVNSKVMNIRKRVRGVAETTGGTVMDPMYLREVETKPVEGAIGDLMAGLRAEGRPIPQIWHLFAFKPDMTRHLSDFTQEVMRGPSPLPPGMRELIAAFTSSRNRCPF